MSLPSSVASIGGYVFRGCTSLREIVFTGNAPAISYAAFEDFMTTAYYPAGDATWTEDVRQNYSGTITWEAYNAGSGSKHEVHTCGTCSWTIDTSGKLSIWPTDGVSGTLEDWGEFAPWYGCASSITSVSVSPGVKAANCNLMFAGCTSLASADLSGLDTSEVTFMVKMFMDCTSLTELDLSRLDFSKVASAAFMFRGCSALGTVTVSDGFSADSLENGLNMFIGCTALIGGNGTAYDADHVGPEYARIDRQGAPGYFTAKASDPEDPPVQEPYEIRVTSNVPGAAQLLGAGSYGAGERVSLGVGPVSADYAFLGWFLDGSLASSEPDFEFDAGADASYEARFGLRGDANANGKVTIVDAQIVFDMANGVYGTDFASLLDRLIGWLLSMLQAVADVTGDGYVDASDARAIQVRVHNGTWE